MTKSPTHGATLTLLKGLALEGRDGTPSKKGHSRRGLKQKGKRTCV